MNFVKQNKKTTTTAKTERGMERGRDGGRERESKLSDKERVPPPSPSKFTCVAKKAYKVYTGRGIKPVEIHLILYCTTARLFTYKHIGGICTPYFCVIKNTVITA